MCKGLVVLPAREVFMLEPRLLMLLAVGTLLLVNGIFDIRRRHHAGEDEGL